MSEHPSDNDSDESPRIPQGVIKSRGGWQGEELELEHQRQQDANHKTSAAAVDLNQFRNTEVGKGYQAKHVVRQKGAKIESISIKDMSKPDPSAKSNKRSRESSKKRKDNSRPSEDKEPPLQRYLKCEGLRAFRKEIEKIVMS